MGEIGSPPRQRGGLERGVVDYSFRSVADSLFVTSFNLRQMKAIISLAHDNVSQFVQFDQDSQHLKPIISHFWHDDTSQ